MRIRALVGVLVAAAVTAPAILAAPGAGLVGYGGQAGAIQGQLGATAGTLPFTGYDLGLFALGAALLMAVGLVVRRAARASN